MSKIRINNWNNKTRYNVIFSLLCHYFLRSWFKMSEHCLEDLLCSLGTDIKFITTEYNVVYWETSNKDS